MQLRPRSLQFDSKQKYEPSITDLIAGNPREVHGTRRGGATGQRKLSGGIGLELSFEGRVGSG